MKFIHVSPVMALLAAAALALPACNDGGVDAPTETSDPAVSSAEVAAAPGAAFGPKAMFTKMFAEADKDNDGKVTEAEARAAATVKFTGADKNRDGSLELDELDAMRKAHWDGKAGPGRGGKMGPRGRGGPGMGGGGPMAFIDADGDGKVALAEFVDGHVDRLKKADANSDGAVTMEELSALAGKMRAHFGAGRGGKGAGCMGGKGPGRGMHGERAAERFGEMDADKDGKVTKAEAEAAHAQRFAELDADKNGVVESAELTARHAARASTRMAERFASLDTDKSGTLSLSEVPPFMAERFQTVDADGNGAISVEEMKAAREGGEIGRRGDRGPRILRMDANDDGKITALEFEQEHAGWFERMDSNGDGAVMLEEMRAGKGGKGGPGAWH